MKLKELIRLALMAIAVSGVLASCTYDEIKPEKVDVPDSVSFSVNIIPIFNKSGGIPP